ncbi:hypothetical protein VIN30_00550 [Adlercreutzia sp. R7]|uniref:Uncharacterized protein n=1 Tax=Adlercreutzia wanghongyangiae TaxID=3111451 RepID=A0ABU6IER7_9ACTN|nr:hypothetical protein [Adlercreutzia sp. R7]
MGYLFERGCGKLKRAFFGLEIEVLLPVEAPQATNAQFPSQFEPLKDQSSFQA